MRNSTPANNEIPATSASLKLLSEHTNKCTRTIYSHFANLVIYCNFINRELRQKGCCFCWMSVATYWPKNTNNERVMKSQTKSQIVVMFLQKVETCAFC